MRVAVVVPSLGLFDGLPASNQPLPHGPDGAGSRALFCKVRLGITVETVLAEASGATLEGERSAGPGTYPYSQVEGSNRRPGKKVPAVTAEVESV